jgi:hypothetical protein
MTDKAFSIFDQILQQTGIAKGELISMLGLSTSKDVMFDDSLMSFIQNHNRRASGSYY